MRQCNYYSLRIVLYLRFDMQKLILYKDIIRIEKMNKIYMGIGLRLLKKLTMSLSCNPRFIKKNYKHITGLVKFSFQNTCNKHLKQTHHLQKLWTKCHWEITDQIFDPMEICSDTLVCHIAENEKVWYPEYLNWSLPSQPTCWQSQQNL